MEENKYLLEEASEKAIAALEILEDVIQPAFKYMRCKGILDMSGKSREACAIDWMEKNFDVLSSASYAAMILIRDVSDFIHTQDIQQGGTTT